jgi:hypothetical protein
LDEFTNELLRQQRRRQLGRFAGTGRNPHGYLFAHPDGRPVRPDWLAHRFRALVRKLGLPPVRLHDLRHGAASLAGQAGVELKVIQHDLGHSRAVTTADTYWTVFRELAHRSVSAAAVLRSHARFRVSLGAASPGVMDVLDPSGRRGGSVMRDARESPGDRRSWVHDRDVGGGARRCR